MKEYLPLISAFIGAVIAQLLAHLFSLRREKISDNKKIYQEFIYPSLIDVILFYKTETEYRRGHDVEIEVNPETVIDKMSEKISYGNLTLVSNIYHYKTSKHFFDGRGGADKRAIIKLFFWFLDFAIEILSSFNNDEQDILEPEVNRHDLQMLNTIKHTQKMYGIWSLFIEELDYEESIDFMKNITLLPKDFIDSLNLNFLKELIEDDDFNSHRKYRFFCDIRKNLGDKKEDFDVNVMLKILNNITTRFERK